MLNLPLKRGERNDVFDRKTRSEAIFKGRLPQH